MDGISILYGTQTGNSIDVAKRIGREAKSRRWIPMIRSLQEVDVSTLSIVQFAIFVTATTGQGNVPDKMKTFWRHLFRKSLKTDILKGLRFAVFGLGDSAYVQFNVVAKKLHNRLLSLGAVQIIHRGLGDDQHDAGYDAALDPWLDQLWNSLENVHGQQKTVSGSVFDDCPFSVKRECIMESFPVDSKAWFDDSIQAAKRFYEIEERTNSNEMASFPSAWNPFFAKLKQNERITTKDHFQDTRHLVFDISQSSFDFYPGDLLAMHPLTPWESIDGFLKRLEIDPYSAIVLDHSEASESIFIARSLVQGVLDVNGASPRRFFFEVLSHFATNSKEKERLAFFSSSAGREEWSLYSRQSGRTVLDVLSDFPSCIPPFEWMLEACPRKLPRKFSIASSLKAFPDELHLTVAIVQYITRSRRVKFGLCSSYLADLTPNATDAWIPCWIEKGSLRFDDTSTNPLILIGPGTGVAPFRAFLQDRLSRVHEDATFHPSPCWLFFGCRNRDGDFYYASEWETFRETGVLDSENGLVTAFSRDQAHKIHVTHKIIEFGSLICDLLINKGAFVFVAGSANKMPNDVRNALKKVLVEHSPFASEEAERFLKQLEVHGKYQIESWT